MNSDMKEAELLAKDAERLHKQSDMTFLDMFADSSFFKERQEKKFHAVGSDVVASYEVDGEKVTVNIATCKNNIWAIMVSQALNLAHKEHK